MPIADVIQFEGRNTDLVWKSPIEDFNMATQLIVDETHEAIVMIEGRSEVIGAGRHTLETQNYFGLGAIQRMATGGKTAFPCKVYFVNKVHAMNMLWGTPDTLPVVDPELDIMLHLQLRGNLSFVVDNSKKFVQKFVGFVDSFNPNQLVEQLRGIIYSEVTDQVAKVMTRAKIGLFSINAHLKDISQLLMYPLGKAFEEYGIKLVKFNIETINANNEDTAEFQAAKSAAKANVIRATGEAEARQVQGYTWSDEQKAAILKELAGNDGAAGSFMGGVLGIGAAGSMSEPINGIIDGFFGDGGKPQSNVFSGDGPTPGPGQSMDGGVMSSGMPQQNASGNPLQFVNEGSTLQQQFGFGLQEAPDMQTQATPPAASAPAAAPPSAGQPAFTTAPATHPDSAASTAQQTSGGTCPQCGRVMDPQWRACPFCGVSLQPRTCPQCGRVMDPQWRACPFCQISLDN